MVSCWPVVTRANGCQGPARNACARMDPLEVILRPRLPSRATMKSWVIAPRSVSSAHVATATVDPLEAAVAAKAAATALAATASNISPSSHADQLFASNPSHEVATVSGNGIPASDSSRRAAAAPATDDLSPSSEAFPNWLQRTTLLLGQEGVCRLRDARVLLVGLGGVGSFVAEFLVRAGVGSLAIVDGDVVDVSNKNRQLPALDSTVGRPKAQVMSQRLLDINPDLNLVVRQEFLQPDGASRKLLEEVAEALHRGMAARKNLSASTSTSPSTSNPTATATDNTSTNGPQPLNHHTDSETERGIAGAAEPQPTGTDTCRDVPAAASQPPRPRLDWVVDCIDSIAPKMALVAAAHAAGARVVSSMGAGGRLDPLAIRIADISDTFGDPFAANVRRGLRRQHGIREGVTVVFSVEPCRRASLALTSAPARFKRSYYGTISYIPALFGLQIAAHIVNSIVGGPMVASEAALRRQIAHEREVATGCAAKPKAKPKAKAKAKATRKAASTDPTSAAAAASATFQSSDIPLRDLDRDTAQAPDSTTDAGPTERYRCTGRDGGLADVARRPVAGMAVRTLAQAVESGTGDEGGGI